MSELSFSVLGKGEIVAIIVEVNKAECVIQCFMSCSLLPSENTALK